MPGPGYNGRIATLDLGTASVAIDKPSDHVYRIYAGGGLLGAWLLLTRTRPAIDPLGPENLLVFTSSAIAGQDGPGLARFSVVTKSPLSGGIAETRCEGPFGRYLKGSGFDALVITGRAAAPVSIVIEDGAIRIADAASTWGRDTLETSEAARATLGRDDVSVAAIGPAGEHLVRYASIVADGSIQAQRLGVGAVMGSKNLKAVVLAGCRLPPVADRAAVDDVARRYATAMATNALTMFQKDPPGFSAYADLLGRRHGVHGLEQLHGGRQPAASDAWTGPLPRPLRARHQLPRLPQRLHQGHRRGATRRPGLRNPPGSDGGPRAQRRQYGPAAAPAPQQHLQPAGPRPGLARFQPELGHGMHGEGPAGPR